MDALELGLIRYYRPRLNVVGVQTRWSNNSAGRRRIPNLLKVDAALARYIGLAGVTA